MKAQITDGGEWRWRQSPEFQAKVRALRESIHQRHALEWANVGFIRRLILRWRMEVEFRRARRDLEPSPGSLYAHSGARHSK